MKRGIKKSRFFKKHMICVLFPVNGSLLGGYPRTVFIGPFLYGLLRTTFQLKKNQYLFSFDFVKY